MSRPRKLILLHSDDLTISLMRLPLECNIKYRVIGEDTEAGALATFEAAQLLVQPFALVIYDCTTKNDFRTVQRMKAIAPDVPVLLLGTAKQLGIPHQGFVMLVQPRMVELLDMVKVMSARKPGPKKHPVLSVGIEREAVCA